MIQRKSINNAVIVLIILLLLPSFAGAITSISGGPNFPTGGKFKDSHDTGIGLGLGIGIHSAKSVQVFFKFGFTTFTTDDYSPILLSSGISLLLGANPEKISPYFSADFSLAYHQTAWNEQNVTPMFKLGVGLITGPLKHAPVFFEVGFGFYPDDLTAIYIPVRVGLMIN